MPSPELLVLDERFNGPPASANGGYACGVLAARVDAPAAEVSLLRPIPLGAPLSLAHDDHGHALLRHGGGLIADARPIDRVDADPPARPTYAQARAASAASPAHRGVHPLPTCFVCGTDGRAEGMRVHTGPLSGHAGVRAAAWRPHAGLPNDGGVLARELVWAALDCPSYPDLGGPLHLLGRMAGEVLAPVRVGEELAVVGWDVVAGGRKRVTATAVVDGDGEVRARALALWIRLRDGALPAAAAA
jgi:hypothetical protein